MTTTDRYDGYPHSRSVDDDGAVIPEYVDNPKPRPRGLYDLPIFGWAWTEDAKQVER